MAELVATAPAGTQACAFDTISFDRTCPVLPWLICSFDEAFYLDHCHPFEAIPAGSNSGQIAPSISSRSPRSTTPANSNTKTTAMSYVSLARPSRLTSTNSTGPRYSTRYARHEDDSDRASILDLIREQCIPWPPMKTGDVFLDSTVSLGLEWDFPTCRASLPTEERLKYLSRVQNMLQGIRTSKKITLLELQEIHDSFATSSSPRPAVFSNGMSSFESNKFSMCWLSELIKKAGAQTSLARTHAGWNLSLLSFAHFFPSSSENLQENMSSLDIVVGSLGLQPRVFARHSPPPAHLPKTLPSPTTPLARKILDARCYQTDQYRLVFLTARTLVVPS